MSKLEPNNTSSVKRSFSIVEDVGQINFESNLLKEYVHSLKEGSVHRLRLIISSMNDLKGTLLEKYFIMAAGPHKSLQNRNCLHLAFQYGIKIKSNELDSSNCICVLDHVKELYGNKGLQALILSKDDNGLSK